MRSLLAGLIRSLFAGVAAIWFAYNALSFLPVPFAYLNDGQQGGIDGDAGAVAVTWAARAIFGGLALVSLALVEWDVIVKLTKSEPSPSDPS
jgi:hypothetical protein